MSKKEVPTVSCKYKDLGCDWIGERRYHGPHLNLHPINAKARYFGCKYVKLKCKYCSEAFLRHELSHHEETVCNPGKKQLLLCKNKEFGCEWTGEKEEYLLAHLNEHPVVGKTYFGCDYTKLKCTYCSESIYRRELSHHEESICLRRPYSCEHSKLCRYKGTNEDPVTNQQHLQICNYRPVMCPNNCGEFPASISLTKHLESHCRNREVECPKNCGEFCAAGELQEHLLDKCLARLVDCPNHCGRQIAIIDLEIHTERWCRLRLTECPNGCGKYSQSEIERHIRDYCIKRFVECPNGCKTRIDPRQMCNHLELCAKRISCPNEQHLPLLCPNDCGEFLESSCLTEHLESCCRNRKVLCPNSCGESCAAGELQDHLLNECRARLVKCPIGCGKQIAIEDLDTHSEWCSHSLVECPYCCGKCSRSELESHIRDSCSRRLVECPNGCEASVDPRQMYDHLEVCTKRIISCPNKFRGCSEWVGRWDELDEHINQKPEREDDLLTGCKFALIQCIYCSNKHRRNDLEKRILTIDPLNIKHLSLVFGGLVHASEKWADIGSFLQVKDVTQYEQQVQDCQCGRNFSECILEKVLSAWLDSDSKSNKTWSAILEALNKVGYKDMAKRIAAKVYCDVNSQREAEQELYKAEIKLEEAKNQLIRCNELQEEYVTRKEKLNTSYIELITWQDKLRENSDKLQIFGDNDPLKAEIEHCLSEVEECQKKIAVVKSAVLECQEDTNSTLTSLIQCKIQLELTIEELHMSMNKLKRLETQLNFEMNCGPLYGIVMSVKNILFGETSEEKNKEGYKRLIPSCKLMVEKLNKTLSNCQQEVSELEDIITKQRQLNARHSVSSTEDVNLSFERDANRSSSNSKSANLNPTPNNTLQLILPVASQWENIGVLLQIPDAELTIIRHDNPLDAKACLREMLRKWVKQIDPDPTWEALADAVEVLHHPSLAKKIRDEYCTL